MVILAYLPQNRSFLVFSDFRAIYGHSTAVAAAATDDSLSCYYYTTRTLVTTWLAIIISGDFLYTIISQACKHPIGNEWENPSGLTLVLIVYRKIADR